jgi:hypothetical protein
MSSGAGEPGLKVDGPLRNGQAPETGTISRCGYDAMCEAIETW